VPPSRPTLATTHLELACLGEQIIIDIQTLMEQGNKSHIGGDFKALAEQLPGLFDSVLDFVGTALATRGHYDNVAHWVEQTYKAVRKLGSASSTAIATPIPSNTPNKPSWARVASLPPPPTEDESTLRQVKVRVTDPIERKAVWTTANSAILQQVVRKADNAGVVGVKKLPSGDLVIQLKERIGKEVLNRRSAWLEQVAPSTKVLPDLYPVLVHGVRISKVDTTKQAEAAKDLEFQNASLHPGLCIKRLSWPRGIQKTGKLNSSLTVFLTSPEMANRVIEQGLVESGEVKMVERFQTGCGLV
jgi:hypothetical protein